MIIMPSRGKPNNVAKFINCYLDTKAKATMLIRIDNDDPAIGAYKNIMRPPNIKLLIGKPKRCVAICNELITAFPDSPNYTMMGDDCEPSPDHWDEALAEAAGFNKLSFGNGSYTGNGTCVPCHPCIGGDIVRHLGYMYHPSFIHDMADIVWTTWGKMFPDRYVHVQGVTIKHNWVGRESIREDIQTCDKLLKNENFKKQLKETYDATRY